MLQSATSSKPHLVSSLCGDRQGDTQSRRSLSWRSQNSLARVTRCRHRFAASTPVEEFPYHTPVLYHILCSIGPSSFVSVFHALHLHSRALYGQVYGQRNCCHCFGPLSTHIVEDNTRQLVSECARLTCRPRDAVMLAAPTSTHPRSAAVAPLRCTALHAIGIVVTVCLVLQWYYPQWFC